MSFQGYIDTIKIKRSKCLDEFKKFDEKIFLGMDVKPSVKEGEVVARLKQDCEPGHGHAMAIYATFKGKKE